MAEETIAPASSQIQGIKFGQSELEALLEK